MLILKSQRCETLRHYCMFITRSSEKKRQYCEIKNSNYLFLFLFCDGNYGIYSVMETEL